MLREERQWLPGKRWAGGLVVCLFAGLGVLLATLRSGADEPKQSVNTSSGTDWRKYVDAKAPGYMIVRPSVALDLPSMEQFRKELNRVFKDEIDVLPGRRGMGVNLDQVECFAGPLQISLQKNNEKGTGVMTVRGQFFRLKTADAAEQWIKHCTASCEKVQHASGTYYRVNHQDKTAKGDILSGSYLLRPDEQTIVFAQTEQEVLSWLSGKESEKANWLAACPEDSGIMTTIVDVKSELVQGMIRQGGFADNKNPVFAPVLTHEGGIACTIEAKDQIHMQFTFGCGNAESAAKKKPQLEAMLSMGKLMLGKEEPEGVEQAKAEFNVLKDLINNLKTTTEGSQVMINTHSSMKLEGVLKQQISELLGPRVK